MDLILPFSFSDFPEDVQIHILSFLNPSELEIFARTSTRFLALCRDDERLWFLKCSRRWGSRTQIQKWGGRKISYRHLYHLLKKYENLTGFWKLQYYWTISHPQAPPSFMFFEWGSFYITGYRILLSKCRGYDLVKKPFLWITATSDGKAISYLDTDGRVSLTEKDLLKEDSEKLGGGLTLVDVQLSGHGFLSVGENPMYLEFRKRLSTRIGWVEYENVLRSTPDGLMTQIREALASKLSVCGDTRSKRERRRERHREIEKWQRVRRWGSQHYEKITECSPTTSRPLQGLWKGICPDRSLRLYRVYYGGEPIKIFCEKVDDSSIELEFYRRDIVFTASCTAFIESPYSADEESAYNSRVHLRPCVEANQDGHINVTSSDHDVLRIFYAHSVYNSNLSFDDADGRIWVYADGTFGFGFLRDDCIVDLKPMVKNGQLLDVMIQEFGD